MTTDCCPPSAVGPRVVKVVCERHILEKGNCFPGRRPSRLRPSGPAWGHNPWKCSYGSCPISPHLLHPLHNTSLPSMLLFFSSSPLIGGVWTTQRDLTAKGGIQGGAPGPQVRPELNLPPSIMSLPPPPLGDSFAKASPLLCAQQANQAISVCHAAAGPGGRREGGANNRSGRPWPHVAPLSLWNPPRICVAV